MPPFSQKKHSKAPALLLDYGGVLMRTRTRAARIAWDARLGLLAGSVERAIHESEHWRLCQLGEMSETAYWAAIAQQLRLRDTELEELRADYFAADDLDQGLIAQLREIRTAGHSVALLSNESRSLPARLADLGIDDLFKPLLVSALLGVMKPQPLSFQIALQLLGRVPGEVIFIDDLTANVQAAAALGIQTLHFREGLPLAAMLAEIFALSS